jgi:predicted RNA-binding protein with PUA-like domain
MAKSYWLMKSEPDVFSIEDLRLSPQQTTPWDGVRNYQARNYMRDSMKIGDRILFYHSNADPSGVAGIAEVASAPYPDPTAFDPKSHYYDPKSQLLQPTWILVDVKWVESFKGVVSLQALRENSQLADMEVLRKGSRLSVQSVTKAHFDLVVRMGRKVRAPQ